MKGIVLILSLLLFQSAYSQLTVVDQITQKPLSKASIFDKNGAFIGVSDENGQISPEICQYSFPLQIRYVGYQPSTIARLDSGKIEMIEYVYQLPEITIDDTTRKYIYLRAYERCYQSGLESTDTLVSFSERMVDFLMPRVKKTKLKGWKDSRILAERTYTHIIKNRKNERIDSISYSENLNNKGYSYEFADEFIIPEELFMRDSIVIIKDGKYFPKDTWKRIGDSFILTRDGLADEKEHKYSPFLLKLLGATTEITREENMYRFNPDSQYKITPDMINEVSYFYDLNLKGKVFKKITGQKDEITLKSYGEIYIVDRAYLTEEEAKDVKENPPVIIAKEFTTPESVPSPPLEISNLKMKLEMSDK